MQQKKNEDNSSKSTEIIESLDNKIEERIYFSEAYLGFLYAFNIEIENLWDIHLQEKDDLEDLRKKMRGLLEEKGIKAEWNENEPYVTEFRNAEIFFKSVPSSFANPIRFKIGSLYVKCSVKGEEKDKEKVKCIFCTPKKIELFLTIFPETKEAILFFNIKIERCDSNDIIFLRQCLMEDRHELLTSNIIPSESDNSKTPICDKKFKIDYYINLIKSIFSEVCEKKSKKSKKLYEKLKEPEEKKTSCPVVIKTNIIEIREITNLDSLNVDNCEDFLLKRYPKQIYSLLVGDEGWNFVPRKVAMSKIKKRWGTREFFTVFAINNSVLVFNFTGTKRYKEYNKIQKELSKRFRQETEGYFNSTYQIAGLEHGPLTNLEIISGIRCYLDNIIKALDDRDIEFLKKFKSENDKEKIAIRIISFIWGPLTKHEEIEKINLMRNAVDKTLIDLNKINKIWEIGELLNIFSENLSIPKAILRLEKKSTSIEAQIMTTYQKNNNLVLGVLTLVTVILTSLGVICAIYEIHSLNLTTILTKIHWTLDNLIFIIRLFL